MEDRRNVMLGVHNELIELYAPTFKYVTMLREKGVPANQFSAFVAAQFGVSRETARGMIMDALQENMRNKAFEDFAAMLDGDDPEDIFRRYEKDYNIKFNRMVMWYDMWLGISSETSPVVFLRVAEPAVMMYGDDVIKPKSIPLDVEGLDSISPFELAKVDFEPDVRVVSVEDRPGEIALRARSCYCPRAAAVNPAFEDPKASDDFIDGLDSVVEEIGIQQAIREYVMEKDLRRSEEQELTDLAVCGDGNLKHTMEVLKERPDRILLCSGMYEASDTVTARAIEAAGFEATDDRIQLIKSVYVSGTYDTSVVVAVKPGTMCRTTILPRTFEDSQGGDILQFLLRRCAVIWWRSVKVITDATRVDDKLKSSFAVRTLYNLGNTPRGPFAYTSNGPYLVSPGRYQMNPTLYRGYHISLLEGDDKAALKAWFALLGSCSYVAMWKRINPMGMFEGSFEPWIWYFAANGCVISCYEDRFEKIVLELRDQGVHIFTWKDDGEMFPDGVQHHCLRDVWGSTPLRDIVRGALGYDVLAYPAREQEFTLHILRGMAMAATLYELTYYTLFCEGGTVRASATYFGGVVRDEHLLEHMPRRSNVTRDDYLTLVPVRAQDHRAVMFEGRRSVIFRNVPHQIAYNGSAFNGFPCIQYTPYIGCGSDDEERDVEEFVLNNVD